MMRTISRLTVLLLLFDPLVLPVLVAFVRQKKLGVEAFGEFAKPLTGSGRFQS